MNAKRKKTIGLFVVFMTALMVLSALGGCAKKMGGNKELPQINPLTGSEKIRKGAIGLRPVAVVVENHPDARPQWGIDDPELSPDILVQGEVEGGITRTLWLYADPNGLPEKVGPIRSARPPFIKLSQWFDSIFIHWGYSHSAEDYIGADTVFYEDAVDHIDRMKYDNKVPLYDRDSSRNVDSEHTGIIYGDRVTDAIKDLGFRRDSMAKTSLKFYKTAKARGEEGSCSAVNCIYSSSSSGWMDTDWTYNEEDKMYHTASFETDVARDNLIILFSETDYVTNHKTTYCNYIFSKGGNAVICSKGSFVECKFKVKDNKFILYTEEKNEDGETVEKAVKLNPGKSWLGLASGNNGGMAAITNSEGKAIVLGDTSSSENEEANS